MGTPNDGQQDVASGTCVATGNEGNPLWVTLGTANADTWGNRFRYRVNGSFAANPAPASADEPENTDGDTIFVSRAQSASGSGAEEFDDMVTWISRSVLLNRMVAAGKLP